MRSSNADKNVQRELYTPYPKIKYTQTVRDYFQCYNRNLDEVLKKSVIKKKRLRFTITRSLKSPAKLN